MIMSGLMATQLWQGVGMTTLTMKEEERLGHNKNSFPQ